MSTSAADARRLGFLRDGDAITMNRERLMADAKALRARTCARRLSAAARRGDSASAAKRVLAALKLGVHLAWRAGADQRSRRGDRPHARDRSWPAAHCRTRRRVSEQYLLDLEREAFLKLCGERKTLERIAHTLKTGKPSTKLTHLSRIAGGAGDQEKSGERKRSRRRKEQKIFPILVALLRSSQALVTSMLFDKGSGPVVVVVQPLHGRWQWMRWFLEALAAGCRVVTYTLAGDFGSDRRMDPEQGFDLYVRQLEDVMDAAKIERAALCGISFGGAVAVRYAARHPDRVTHLVVASSPGPGWRANPEQTSYVARPLLTLPVFAFAALMRLYAEVAAALPRPADRLAFALRSAIAVLRYPAWPPLMAARVRLLQTLDLAGDCARITAPTLVVTGDSSLDRVVPVDVDAGVSHLHPQQPVRDDGWHGSLRLAYTTGAAGPHRGDIRQCR